MAEQITTVETPGPMTNNERTNIGLGTGVGANKNSGIPKNSRGEPYDVVTDYAWTVSRGTNVRPQVPRIQLIEYQQTVSALVQSLDFWYKQATTNVKAFAQGTFSAQGVDAYKALYTAQPTGRQFILPYYSPYNHDVSNNWGENKGPLGNAVDNYILPVAKVIFPSGGIESAKAWEGSTEASYGFTFQLLNTIDPNTDISKNIELIQALVQASLPYKLNVLASLPPMLYEVTIPGIRYSPVAVISNLKVENLGQLNYNNGQNVPEAYEVTVTITELLMESRQIYNVGMAGGRITTAIVNSNVAQSMAKSRQAAANTEASIVNDQRRQAANTEE